MEGKARESGISSRDGDGQLGNNRLKGEDGAVADLDSQPVDGGIDDAVLVERGEAVVNGTTERELRVQINDKPIVAVESVQSIRSNVEVSVRLPHARTWLEENRRTIGLISIRD